MYLERVDIALSLDIAIAKRRGDLEFDDLVDSLKGILSNVWKKSTREALIGTIKTLEKFSGPVTAAEVDMIDEMVSGIMGMDLDTATKKNLVDIQEAAYLLGETAAAKGTGARIAWNLADQKALNVLDTNLRYWIGSYYDDNLQEGFKGILQDYFEGGYNRHELAILMKEHFRALGDKGLSYWNLLADHTATKTREIGRVAGYEKAGVEVIRVKAHLDSRTTEVCRRLHGHVIAVEDIRRQVGNYLKACETRNKDKIRASWPWWSDKDAAKKMRGPGTIQNLVKRGKVGLPPYHARCRTITVSEFFANPGDHESDFFGGKKGKKKPATTPKRKPRKAPAKTGTLGGVKTYADVKRVIREKLGHLGRNNPINVVEFSRAKTGFMWTYSSGDVYMSTAKFRVSYPKKNGFLDTAKWSPGGAVKDAMRKIDKGEALTFLEEYSLESLWHEIQHNRQAVGRAYGSDRAIMEVVNQWTARRTYQKMLKELGAKPAFQDEIKKNGLGYRQWVANFDRLLEKLGINEKSIMNDMVAMNEGGEPRNRYKFPLANLLARKQKGGDHSANTLAKLVTKLNTPENLFLEALDEL